MSTVRTICPTCGHAHHWSWESAFDKFGFQDGGGLVMTEAVAEALRKHGCEVRTMHWGFHNTIITTIEKNGADCIPSHTHIGYDEPRAYLPAEIIRILDEAFLDGSEVEP